MTKVVTAEVTSTKKREGSGMRNESLRNQNLATMLRLLHLEGPSSRANLGRRTGLTRSAIGGMVNDLASFGLVEESAPNRDGTPGRPSPIVEPVGRRNVVIGADLMVDSIGVAVVGLGGSVLHSIRRDRPRNQQRPEESVGYVCQLIQKLRSDLDPATRIFGVGVAVPGLIAKGTQRVLLAPNLKWENVDIEGLFRPAIADLPLFVGNDADVGVLAESRRGAAAGKSHVLYLSCEVGVGAGVISGGPLLSGARGFGGEVGHLPVNPDGQRCGCGAVGCLETEIGERAMLRRAGWPPDGGRQAVDEVLQAAASGSSDVINALLDHSRWLSIGLTGLINIFDVEIVVLGGLLGRLFPFIGDAVADELAVRVLPALRDTPIVPSAIGEDATLIGASELVWDTVLSDTVLGPLGRQA